MHMTHKEIEEAYKFFFVVPEMGGKSLPAHKRFRIALDSLSSEIDDKIMMNFLVRRGFRKNNF